MTWKEHTFVICAYKTSPYLEACIQSLLGQKVKSQVLMATSTPNDWILGLAKKYGLPLMAREGKSSLAADWNFAYAQAQTPFVTLAHQDDVYGASYTWRIKNAAGKADRPLLLFTDYGELRAGKTESVNSFLRIKRLLLFPLRNQRIQKQIWVRRRILSLGNPICCPAVTYGKERLPGEPFREGFSSNTDWEAWERISRLQGSFVYIPHVCMAHRIHGESATTRIIEGEGRQGEDFAMFSRFWPGRVAAWLEGYYKKSEEWNHRGE